MEFNLFCNHFGDSLTLIPLRVTPAYLGQASSFLTSMSINKLSLSFWNELVAGAFNISSSPKLFRTARKSLATPK